MKRNKERVLAGVYESSMKISLVTMLIVTLLEVFMLVYSIESLGATQCIEACFGGMVRKQPHCFERFLWLRFSRRLSEGGRPSAGEVADERMYAAKGQYYLETGEQRRI